MYQKIAMQMIMAVNGAVDNMLREN